MFVNTQYVSIPCWPFKKLGLAVELSLVVSELMVTVWGDSIR